MTEFQEEVRGRVEEILAQAGLRVNFEVQGIDEKYYRADVGDKVLWIYLDAAEISGPNTDLRFEHGAYKRQEDLASDFYKQVREVIIADPSRHTGG